MAPLIRFEEFDLDVDRYELRRAGHAVKLERIPMELLILLLQSDGKLVAREAINRRLWGENAQQDTDHSVNTAVNKLRSILRDKPSRPRFIQTVVGQGYRFICKVDAEAVSEIVRALPPAESRAVAVKPAVAPLPSLYAGSLPLPPVLEVPTAPAEPRPPIMPESDGGVEKPSSPMQQRPRTGWLAAMLVSAALLVAAGVGYRLTHRGSTEQPAAPAAVYRSIAILPFTNLARNADQDYIVDGMTDQLITDLASSTSLRVTSRSSVMHYKGSQASMSEIARTLHVDAILEGSFLHNGKQVRITANLIDPRDDRHLWAQVYEESGDDLLDLQEPVTRDIVREIGAALGMKVSALRLRPLNVKARDAYLRGRFEWNKRTIGSMAESISYYQQAIAADPGYAEAYAAMGDAYVLLSSYGSGSPLAALNKAQQAAEKALQQGGGLAEAHTVLGAVRTDRDWDWPAAEAEYKRAITLNPSYPTARHWYSLHLSRLGRTQPAEAEIQRARLLDPLSPIIAVDAAETAYWARNPHEAMQRVDQVLALNPAFGEAHLIKGKIYESLKLYEPALAEYKLAMSLFGEGTNVMALQGHALALGGASEAALSIAHQLQEASLHTYVSGADIGQIYCALGRPNDAMRWLNRGFDHRDRGMDMLSADPLFDGCRQDPRFQKLLQRLKLQPSDAAS